MINNCISNDVIEEDGIKALNDILPTYRCQTFVKISSTEASLIKRKS